MAEDSKADIEQTLEQLLADPQHQKCIQELQAFLKDNNLEDAFKGEDVELILLRSSIGFKSDAKLAQDSLKASAEYRTKYQTWNLPDVDNEADFIKTTPHLAKILTFFTTKFFWPALDGNTATFRYAGYADIIGLMNSMTIDQWEESSVSRIVLQGRFINKQSRKFNRIVQIVTILDMENITQDKRLFLEWFKRETQVAQTIGPEMLKAAIVLNVPWFFNVLWKLVSGFLSPRTIKKVAIAGKGEQEILNALTPHLGADNVPSYYKGPMDSSSWDKKLHPLEGFTEKQIGAGTSFEEEVEVKEGGITVEFAWRIQSKDVTFSAVFQPADGSEEIEVASPAKETPVTTTYRSNYACQTAGKLIVKWDNKASYFTGKTVYYKIFQGLTNPAL